jgi:hypothetical protein
MSLNQEIDTNKNFLNRIHYLINKKLSTLNLNKIDNIYENTQTMLKEYEKQNNKLNNKINVLENLMILMNKEIIELKKKVKNNKNVKEIVVEEKVKNKDLISEIMELENSELNAPKELVRVSSMTGMEYKEIKKEKIILDIEFVKNNLHNHNMSSDMKLFKKIYISEFQQTDYSIRHINGNYQYWLNGKMNNDDENANYIKDTVITNISNIYLDINLYDNYKEDMDLFLKNQEYILDMNKQKYKDKFFKNILKIIDYK